MQNYCLSKVNCQLSFIFFNERKDSTLLIESDGFHIPHENVLFSVLSCIMVLFTLLTSISFVIQCVPTNHCTCTCTKQTHQIIFNINMLKNESIWFFPHMCFLCREQSFIKQFSNLYQNLWNHTGSKCSLIQIYLTE